ncbi:MAG: hypothetical protein C6I01_01685 [Epsilonproteobacteria bacterium]|jgi:hypothetical protein|nr:hypothetical protein [Campylobacterota bacterium]NPA89336.1 hypothetical protein [Campylobacterota bacterium]
MDKVIEGAGEIFHLAVEYDINPLVLFNREGKIVYYNREAEILLSYLEVGELFDFALQKSPLPPQKINLHFEPLKFGELEFAGYWVALHQNDYLLLRFFINTSHSHRELEGLELVDLTLFLEWFIDYILLTVGDVCFVTYFDPSIPPFYFNKRELFRLLKKGIEGKNRVEITTKILIGEYILIGKNRFPAVEIGVKVDSPIPLNSNSFDLVVGEDGYKIRLPLIKERNENSNFG